MNENEFATGSVPVMVAARIYGKDASWVRAGIISGWLPIGKATRNGQLVTKIEDMNSKYGRINFYISPKRLYEETGYVWKGEKAYAIDVIRRFLNRDYERDGKGGLFTIEHCRYDMRDIEIWYQANWYLDNVR